MNGEEVNAVDEITEYKNTSQLNSTSNIQVNWMEKLKPSNKNRLIQKKYQNLSNANSHHAENDKLTNFGIDVASMSNIDREESILNESLGNNLNLQKKWNKYVMHSKFNNLQIDTEVNYEVFHVDQAENFIDNSIICFEEIGNIIEEKYKNAYSENMFLKQRYHSILPFLLISNKEVHRVCLSDYEIKYTYKNYKAKSKSFRAESFDYYRIGIINFYKGKYLMAYNSFKSAIKYKERDINIIKWYCFTAVVLILCQNNKINFQYLKSIKLEEEYTYSNDNKEEEGFTFFGCCSSRKSSNSNKFKNLQMQIVNNGTTYDYLITPTEGFRDPYLNFLNSQYDKGALAKDVIPLLALVIDNASSKQNQVEGWWIMLLISTFCSIYPTQILFSDKSIPDPKYCVKKIKEIDDYLSYIAYAEYNYLINDNFQIDKILKQLISKYPSKVEAYLRYWQLLTKGKFKNYDLANSISEIYWKNSSTMHFDDGIYSLYILITHAKSACLIGNHFYAITYYQKEYPSNFLFPSIYYLFGKYSSKSNSKYLKKISISSLKEVYRLVYEDLQYSSLYWLGNIYYNTGNYDNCFEVWKIYMENAEKSFDISHKKVERMRKFMKQYEVVWNSLQEFKKNMNLIKKLRNYNVPSSNQVVNTSNSNHSTKMNTNVSQSSKLASYLKTINSIQEIEMNLKMNKSIIYDYYKALCFFYIDKNTSASIKLLMTIIKSKQNFMPALFAMSKILAYLNEHKLLLNFSYLMIKIAHQNDVTFCDWTKSYILYSKALLLNKKHDEAIMLLITTLDVFAHIPLEEAKYLNSIYLQNKISTTNFFVDFDKALRFYSKYHVYEKSVGIFHINYTLKKSKKNAKSEKFVLNLKDINEEGCITVKNVNSRESSHHDHNHCNLNSPNKTNNTNQFPDSNDITQTNGNHETEEDSLAKLEEYIEMQIEGLEIPTESPFLTIISNPEIFLEIGKICAKSETKRELGLICLEDYIQLLKFTHNYKLNDNKDKKKQKAYFWMSILHIQLKQYNQAKQCIDKIDKLYEIDTAKKKTRIVKMFIDFYKQFVSENDSISFDFEISKEDLKEI